jgi:TolA-binding protein
MKTNLIRTAAILVLGTSISAFAQTADTKSEDAVITCSTATQQNDSDQDATDALATNVSLALEALQEEVEQLQADDKANQQEQQKAAQEKRNQVRQEDKSWDHALMGIYGG